MKFKITIFSCLIAIFLSSPVFAKQKLAVMDLEATFGIDEGMAYAMSDVLRDAIHSQGEYEVLSKEDLDALARRTSLQIQAGECTDSQCLADLGKALGSKYMVYGTISKVGSTYSISLRLLDTEGENAGVKNRINERCICNDDELFDTVIDAATKIMGSKQSPSQDKVKAKSFLTPLPVATKLPFKKTPKPTGASWIEPNTNMTFLKIKGDCFKMGSSWPESGGEYDESPKHKVCVDDFYIAKYEVTQGQWEKTMGNNPSYLQHSSYPVNKISWQDTQEFITKLNNATGLLFRLPSEAEWEFSARAGTNTNNYWGNSVDATCKYANVLDKSAQSSKDPTFKCDDLNESLSLVGYYKPNEFGLHDMMGNVWEWCQDWYGPDYYKISPERNPGGPKDGLEKVLRGGSFLDKGKRGHLVLRSAERWSKKPDYKSYKIGFRLIHPSD